MNIEELRAAAETLKHDALQPIMPAVHRETLVGMNKVALMAIGMPSGAPAEQVARCLALAASALPALLAVVEAAEAETKHPEHHGHWYGYMPNSTTPNPCPCALCAALRHLNEKGTDDADKG